MTVNKEISIFVDESGSFAPMDADPNSPYYLLCMLFHNQSDSITAETANLDEALAHLGIPLNCAVHAGPLIRREAEYQNLTREHRIGIFRRMMIFLQKVNIRYRCFQLYKRYNTKQDAIHDVLLQSLVDFLIKNRQEFNESSSIKIYYDDGQAQIKQLLKEAFLIFQSKVKFVPDVSPTKYRLFQVADVACTIELIAAKLSNERKMSLSEFRFFGGPKNFLKNYLKPLRRKIWSS